MPHIDMQRESATMQGLTYRASSLSTLDEEKYSVEAIVATDSMVTVLDRSSYRIIDEVLVAEGGTFPDNIPLLDSHRNYGSADVLGGASDFRREGGQWIGKASFDNEDDNAMRVYGKVKKRFINAVSIGYRVSQAVEIRPGESATIGGKKYTANPNRVLRVAQKWRAFELSVTPIGADERAKFREGVEVLGKQEDLKMNPRLVAYLRRLGLAQDADEQTSLAFVRGLTGAQRTIANALDYGVDDTAARTSADLAIRSLGYDPDNPWNVLQVQRSEPAAQQTQQLAPVVELRTAGDDGASLLELGRRQEQERQIAIRGLAGPDIPQDVVNRALAEGWDVARASQEFLTAMRGVRPNPSSLTDGRGPAIHTRGRDQDINRMSLLSGLMERTGLNVAENLVTVRNGGTLDRPRTVTDDMQRAAERGYAYRDMSLIDIMREGLRLDGVEVGHNRTEIIEAGFRSMSASSSTLSYIFTSNYSAQLLMGYEGLADSTLPWTSTGSLPDFKTTERTRMYKGAKPKRLAPGKEADHVTRSDKIESYKIARYASQFVVDEQDIINDTFGALEDSTPKEMGEAAAELRGDLVYAILLANANMADSVALFHSTHGNVSTSSALNAANLESAVANINKMTDNGRILGTAGRLVLLTPWALWATASRLTRSTSRYKDTDEGEKNPLADLGIQTVSDARLDSGVVDPATETSQSGSSTTWYLAAPNRHTVEVGYLRGSNNRPNVRSFALTQGRWGIGFDVQLDIGAKALDWLGLRRHTA